MRDGFRRTHAIRSRRASRKRSASRRQNVHRGSGLAIPLVAGAVAIAASLALACALMDTNPRDMALLFADQAGITNANAEAQASVISYAAYASMADQTWNAGETSQEVSIWLPATATHTDEDGTDVTEDNPVYAAPHIYVDLNSDGEFSSGECVWNPMEYDEEGRVTNVGQLLMPGHEVTSIELTQPLEAGTYDAELVWTGVTIDTKELANPMSFRFGLTVR